MRIQPQKIKDYILCDAFMQPTVHSRYILSVLYCLFILGRAVTIS